MDVAVLAVRTILSLAVVLGLIWYAGRRLNDSASGRGGDGKLAAWVRKAGGAVGRTPARGRRRAERPAPLVAVVGRQAIGPKASVAVVDVGGQRLVLGVSESGISLLTTLEAPVAVAAEAIPEPVAAPDVVHTAIAQDAPDFDEVFAAATTARAVNGSILSPATWRQARTALRTGPTS